MRPILLGLNFLKVFEVTALLNAPAEDKDTAVGSAPVPETPTTAIDEVSVTNEQLVNPGLIQKRYLKAVAVNTFGSKPESRTTGMTPQGSKSTVKPNSTTVTAAATKPASRKKGPMKQTGTPNYFASGKHLTLAKANLIAGEVGELTKMTDDKTEIMNGLKPFAKKHNIALSMPYSKRRKYTRGIPSRL